MCCALADMFNGLERYLTTGDAWWKRQAAPTETTTNPSSFVIRSSSVIIERPCRDGSGVKSYCCSTKSPKLFLLVPQM